MHRAYFFSTVEQMKATLNEQDLLTLLAILRLEGEAYGVSLCREITAITGRVAALASVYKTLDGLEQRGLITSRMGEPTAERGGRAKRFLRVTAKGDRAIDTTRPLLNTLWKDVPTFGRDVSGGFRKGRA